MIQISRGWAAALRRPTASLTSRGRTCAATPPQRLPHRLRPSGPMAMMMANVEPSSSNAPTRNEPLLLHAALEVGSAHKIVAAALAEPCEIRRLLGDVAHHGESVQRLISACIAVLLPSSQWPPWIAARLARRHTCASRQTLVVELHEEMAAHHARYKHVAPVATWLCAHIQQHLRGQLKMMKDKGDVQPLAAVMLLNAIIMATTCTSAAEWGRRALPLGREAVGCALKAFCVRQRTLDGGCASVESQWLHMWEIVCGDDGPTMQHDASMECAVGPANVLRISMVEWHAHCLLRQHRSEEAARLLHAHHRTWGGTGASLHHLSADALAEVFAVMFANKTDAMRNSDADVLRRQVGGALISHMLADAETLPRAMGKAAFVPSASANAAIYSAMLHHLQERCEEAASSSSSSSSCTSTLTLSRCVGDLRVLLSMANPHALAASMVPAGLGLETVMRAEPDEQRRMAMERLGRSMEAAIRYLCGDASSSSSSASLAAVRLSAEEQEAVRAAVESAAHALCRVLQMCSSQDGRLPTRAAEPAWRRRLRQQTEVRTHKYQLLLAEMPHTCLRNVLHALLSTGYVEHGWEVGACLAQHHFVDLRFYELHLLGSLYQAGIAVEAEVPHTAEHIKALYIRRASLFGETIAPDSVATAIEEHPRTTNTMCGTTNHALLGESDAVMEMAPSRPISSMLVHCLLHRSVFAAGGRLLMDSALPLHRAYLITTSAGIVGAACSEDAPHHFSPWEMKGCVATS